MCIRTFKTIYTTLFYPSKAINLNHFHAGGVTTQIAPTGDFPKRNNSR